MAPMPLRLVPGPDLRPVLHVSSLSQTVRKLGMGLSVAALLLGGLEGALRASGFKHHTPRPILIWNNLGKRDLQRLDAIYRFHPYWFWEPRPGARIADFHWDLMPAATFHCGAERINAVGYRGPDRPRPSGSGTLRIAVLGDSSTFGVGVCLDETYATLLERELPNAEVLNFGVAGFSAFQGEKLFEDRVLTYRPLVVLAAFGAHNELSPAGSHDVDAKFQITSHASPLAVLWADRLSGLRVLQLVEWAFSRKAEGSIELKARENWDKWTRGSDDYIRNQSLASFERSLERIVRLGRSHDARVILIVPPLRRAVEMRQPWADEYARYTTAIKRVASRLNAPYWDARAALRAVPNSDERLFLDDYHPNVAGHRIYAKFLAEKLLHEMEYESKAGNHRP